MQKNLFILLFIPLFYIYSCEKQTHNCPDLIQSESISNYPIDLYGVNNIELVDHQLNINVSYGGGCEVHEFKLINIINPIDGGGQQINVLHLSHNANNDGCFAEIIEHQLCFDISDIINDGSLYFSHPDSMYDLN